MCTDRRKTCTVVVFFHAVLEAVTAVAGCTFYTRHERRINEGLAGGRRTL